MIYMDNGDYLVFCEAPAPITDPSREPSKNSAMLDVNIPDFSLSF